MADRFPSLDDFDAGQTEVQGGSSGAGNAEQPSDFLARERAALGDDAEQFATSDDKRVTAEEADDDDDDDLLGGGGHQYTSTANGNGDLDDFESSFPAVDTGNDGVAPGGTVTGSTLPFRAGGGNTYVDEAEPEVIRAWRERRDLQIQHRDESSATKKTETVKAAQESIDEFYENYNTRKDKQIAQTRKEAEDFLKNREDTTSGGTSWERIAKLVDLSGKGTAGGAPGSGKAKMREMLLSLRKDENAPGAKAI